MGNKGISLRMKIALIICGTVLALVLAEAGLRLAGWLYRSRDTIRNTVSRSNIWAPNTVRVLCVGSCYTVGVGVDPGHTYPRYLERILQRQYPRASFAVINRGVRSKNLSYFVDSLQQYLDQYRPHCIILNINYRMDLGDKNLAVSSPQLIPFFDGFVIKMEHFLKQSKIYKVGRLMFGEKDSSGRAFKRLTDFERMNESGSTQEMEIQAFENKLRNDPRDVSALIGLAGVYYAQGLFENAAENTRKAIAFEPGNGWYYLYLFWDYVFLREYDKAVEAQKKALAVNPQLKAEISARIEDTKRMFRSRGAVSDRFYLSDQYALIGDYAEALRVCRDALQRDPFYVEYYDKMAFYEHVLNNDGTVRTGGNVTDGAHKPWAFIDEAAGRWNRADGYALFYRLLKYDLEKALVLTEGRDMKIILENMGSTFQQQAVIGKVCSELKIPLVDLYSVFNGAGVQSRFFHPTLTSRLSAEGNERAAEEISRILEKEGVFDEYR